VIKYKVAEKKLTSDSAKSEKAKKGNDKIMDNIWKLMKYTQGENNQNKSMQFCMPVFIHIETLWRQDERHKLNDDNDDVEEELEVKLMLSLPPEYQSDSKDPNKIVLEPPSPNDESIIFETLDEFKCYVR